MRLFLDVLVDFVLFNIFLVEVMVIDMIWEEIGEKWVINVLIFGNLCLICSIFF